MPSRTRRLPSYDIPLDEDFINDSNPAKYIILWTTNAYKKIQRECRIRTPSQLAKNCPNIFSVIQNIILYFESYSITKDKIQHLILYKGISNMNRIPNEFQDSCVISTSSTKGVSERFAGIGGQLLTFNVVDLPDDIEFVEINQNMAPHLQEDEYLLLPGTIKVYKDDICKYNVNHSLVNQYKEIATPSIIMYTGGKGTIEPLKKSKKLLYGIDRYNICGKHIVYYRAIYNEPVEIVGRLIIPQDVEESKKYINLNLKPLDNQFENMTDFIPEFKNLEKKYSSLKNKDTQSAQVLHKKLQSYYVHNVLFDPITKKSSCLYWDTYPMFFNEIFDMNREKEVIETIESTIF